MFIDSFFVPGIISVIMFGCIVNSSYVSNAYMYVPVESLVSGCGNILEKVDNINFQGTLGTCIDQTVYINNRYLNSYRYIQFEANNSLFFEMFLNQYCNNEMKILKVNNQVNIRWDSNHYYIIELKSKKIIYILETDLKPNEIKFLL